jgi:polysaccharide biosynthesis protein PslG
MRRGASSILGAAALLLVLCVSAAGAHLPHGFFGVNVPVPAKKGEVGRMAHGGVKTVRFGFGWPSIEPTESGGFAWGSTDSKVALYARRHIEVLALFYGTPSWLTHQYWRPPLRSKEARSRWRRFLRTAADRYGVHGSFWANHPDLPYEPIRHWQIWNEPNLPAFFAPKPSPKRYARLLHISATALRKADSHAKIVLAGMPHTAERPGQVISYKFLHQLYKLGAKKDFDDLAIHPYAIRVGGVNGLKDQLDAYRKVSRRFGDRHKPLWIDEIGWSSNHERANRFAVGKQGQARKLRKAFRFILGHRKRYNVQRLIWFKWRDSKVVPSTCAFCAAGLETRRGHAKPAWRAYKRFAR